MTTLREHPVFLGLLEDMRQAPADDQAPALILADWLDDHGENDWAMAIRSQCASNQSVWMSRRYVRSSRQTGKSTSPSRNSWYAYGAWYQMGDPELEGQRFPFARDAPILRPLEGLPDWVEGVCVSRGVVTGLRTHCLAWKEGYRQVRHWPLRRVELWDRAIKGFYGGWRNYYDHDQPCYPIEDDRHYGPPRFNEPRLPDMLFRLLPGYAAHEKHPGWVGEILYGTAAIGQTERLLRADDDLSKACLSYAYLPDQSRALMEMACRRSCNRLQDWAGEAYRPHHEALREMVKPSRTPRPAELHVLRDLVRWGLIRLVEGIFEVTLSGLNALEKYDFPPDLYEVLP